MSTGLAKMEDNVGYFDCLVRDSSRIVRTEPWVHYLHLQSSYHSKTYEDYSILCGLVGRYPAFRRTMLRPSSGLVHA